MRALGERAAQSGARGDRNRLDESIRQAATAAERRRLAKDLAAARKEAAQVAAPAVLFA